VERGARSVEQGAWSRGVEGGGWSVEQGAWSVEQGAWSRGNGAKPGFFSPLEKAAGGISLSYPFYSITYHLSLFTYSTHKLLSPF